MNAIDHLILDPDGWMKLIQTSKPSSIVVLSDSTTRDLCVPVFIERYLGEAVIHQFTVEPGEASKSLKIAESIYEKFMVAGIDRDAILVNIGGGVVTDLGGFIGSTYKRGIKTVNVPTTHLGMVDASLGGKNGVNLNGYKNQIGTFYPPKSVIIDPVFLRTLPETELMSGWIETVKHALIGDTELWEMILVGNAILLAQSEEIIRRSAQIKLKIVEDDLHDIGFRQALNYGHTIGHAIEAESTLRHGEAVAFGMVSEAYISHKICGLPLQQLDQITAYIKSLNLPLGGLQWDRDKLVERMRQDKKNTGNAIQFALLEAIGKVSFGEKIPTTTLAESLVFAHQQLVQ